MARQPFYGRGPGPQIARMDMNAATAPGRAYGQMFANLGKIAGDSIEKYAEGKKKKEEQKQTASFIKRALINSPEIAAQFGIQGDDSMTFEEAVDQGSNAIAKDPKGFEMVKGFTAMAAQQRKAQQETELFNRKISQLDQSQETAKELKEKTAGFEEFLSEQPQVIDPTGPGRFDVLRNLREGKGVTPPARMIPGASPAEEMLMSPEAKSFARRAVEGGQPMSLVMPMAQKIDSQIAAQQLAEKKAAPSAKEMLDYNEKLQGMEIDRTEFKQKQDAIGFKPEINYLDLGEVRFGISGKYANETEVAKIKSDVIPDYSNMNAITDQLIKMGEDIEGDIFVSPSDKVLAEALKSSLQGLIREDILGPGTVNDSERAILEQVIENPVEYFNVKRNRRDKINSLKGLRKKAFNKLRTRFKGLGLDVSEFGQGGNAPGLNKSSNMQNKTDRGLSFEEISLDEL